MPTIGRSSLERALRSLVAQKDRQWNAIVVFDNVKNQLPIKDRRIKAIYTDSKIGKRGINGEGGFVRNKAIPMIESVWTAFLDDDDSLTNNYVQMLKNENQALDLVIFRMKYKNGRALPRSRETRIIFTQVGISYAVKTNFIKTNKILFRQSSREDFDFLQDCQRKGAKFTISPHVTYLVKH